MTRLGISLPVLNSPYEKFSELARLADDAGFDSVWDYEFYRNPFVIHGLTAVATERIQLGAGLANAVSRTPFEMANAAADVDELSGGRVILGVGTGGMNWVEHLNGIDLSSPVERIREYVETLRQIWDYMSTGEEICHDGPLYKFEPPPLNPWGPRTLARPRIPIYVAAMRSKMLSLAGEVADGVLGFFYTPQFVVDRVHPHVTKGAQLAGRDVSDVEVASFTICSVSNDRDEALRRARFQVGMYACYPVTDVIIGHMGFTKERDALLRVLLAEGPAGFEHAVSDELVEAFSISGTPDECRKKLSEYEQVMPHVLLHTPYVPPLTADESEDAYRGIVETFGS